VRDGVGRVRAGADDEHAHPAERDLVGRVDEGRLLPEGELRRAAADREIGLRAPPERLAAGRHEVAPRGRAHRQAVEAELELQAGGVLVPVGVAGGRVDRSGRRQACLGRAREQRRAERGEKARESYACECETAGLPTGDP